MTKVKSKLLLGAAILGTTLSSSAWAQTTSDDSNIRDIVVTARRIEERLQDVPISISVVSQQQLSNRNVVDSSDLARYTPSLSANTNFGSDNTTFAIRGFVQDIGSAPSVGTYFADVVSPRGGFLGYPVGDGAGPGSFFDLQNVQVLKGPQGTLQGRNTTGGAVLLVPQKPGYEFGGYLEGGIGNYGMRSIQGVINVPLNDVFRVRLGIDRMTRDGYLKNVSEDAEGNRLGPDAFANIDYTAVRGSFVADLTPNLENYTIVSYLDSRNNGNIQKLFAAQVGANGVPAYPGSMNAWLSAAQLANNDGFYDVRNSLPGSYTRTKQWQIINTTTWQANDNLTVKNIASYAELKQWQRSPQFGTEFDTTQLNFGNFPYFSSGTTPVPPPLVLLGQRIPSGYYAYLAAIAAIPGMPSSNQNTFTEELQLQGRNGALTWQAGGYFERSAPLGISGVMNAVSGLACTGNPQDGNCLWGVGGTYGPSGYSDGALDFHTSRTHTQSIGLYAQGTYALTSKLNLTAGFRYTWDQAKDTSQYYAMGVPVFGSSVDFNTFTCIRAADNVDPQNCISTLKKKSSAPTWLISLDYKPIEDVMVYAKWARGYRTGGVYPTAPTGFLTFNPEHVDNFEIGAKTGWRGVVPGSLDLAAFYNNFRDQQLQIGFYSPAGDPPTAAIANVGKSRIYGLEADLHLGPVAGFAVDVNYAYLNTKIQRFSGVNMCDVSVGTANCTHYGNYVAVGGDLVGQSLLLAPKHKLAIVGSYTLPLDEHLGKITLGATYTYQSSQQSNYSDGGHCWATEFTSDLVGSNTKCSDLGKMPGYGLLNFNVNWTSVGGKPVDLSFFMTNVTEKKYYVYYAGTLGYGFETGTVGAPRMFGARARVHF